MDTLHKIINIFELIYLRREIYSSITQYAYFTACILARCCSVNNSNVSAFTFLSYETKAFGFGAANKNN
jgi:hypothetical protein